MRAGARRRLFAVLDLPAPFFNPAAPLLIAPPRRGRNGRPVRNAITCLRARDYWSRTDRYRQRHSTHPELALRRKVGAQRLRKGKAIGTLLPHDTEVKQHKMAQREADKLRLLSFLGENHSIRSGYVGGWNGRRIVCWSRQELAERAAFPAGYDRKGIMRCDRLDRCLDDLVAAGHVIRYQLHGKDDQGRPVGEIAILRVTEKFWRLSGVWKTRKRELEGNRPEPARARDEDQAGALGRLVGELLAGARPDYGPNGPRPPPG
jgi:hypothetical protein